MIKHDVHTTNKEPSPILELCGDESQAISLENHRCNKILNSKQNET